MDDPIFGSDGGPIGFGYYGPSQNETGDKSDTIETKADLRKLEQRLNRMTLACQSMWELIRDHTDFTEEDLEKKILEVDLRDGKADGTMGPEVLACPSCKRNTNSHRSNCLYCGTLVTKSSQFT